MTTSTSPRNGPIFIVGAPRSGTTMLQYRLRNHPRISFPTGESHFIIPLYQNQAAYSDVGTPSGMRRLLAALYDFNSGFLDTDLHGVRFDVETLASAFLAEGRASVRDVIAGIFEHNARGQGKTRWGDKTPYYVMHIPKLIEWFPDAQIVHLIRDGRDVALSLFARQHDFYVYNAYFAAEYWESYVEKGRKFGRQLGDTQYLEVRYEDLLDTPDTTMKALCAFLGEEFSTTLFDVEAVDDPGQTPLVHKPLQADNAGKWRHKMSAAQIKAFESISGPTLRACGYKLTTEARLPSIITKAAYRLHNQLLTAYWQHNKKKLS